MYGGQPWSLSDVSNEQNNEAEWVHVPNSQELSLSEILLKIPNLHPMEHDFPSGWKNMYFKNMHLFNVTIKNWAWWIWHCKTFKSFTQIFDILNHITLFSEFSKQSNIFGIKPLFFAFFAKNAKMPKPTPLMTNLPPHRDKRKSKTFHIF